MPAAGLPFALTAIFYSEPDSSQKVGGLCCLQLPQDACRPLHDDPCHLWPRAACSCSRSLRATARLDLRPGISQSLMLDPLRRRCLQALLQRGMGELLATAGDGEAESWPR